MHTKRFLALNKSLLYGPIFAVSSYLLIGVGIATFGPLQYEGYRSELVAGYMILIIFFLCFGFFIGSSCKVPTRAIWRRQFNQGILTIIFRYSLIASILLMTYELVNAILTGGVNLSLSDSALAYSSTYSDYTRNSGSYSTHFIITSLGAFPLFVSQVLGVYYFKNISRV